MFPQHLKSQINAIYSTSRLDLSQKEARKDDDRFLKSIQTDCK